MKKLYHRQLFVGPMSKNVVDAIRSHDLQREVGLIPSRRQVDSLPKGYVNNWTTAKFLEYTKKENFVRCRDHAGPLQGSTQDDGLESLRYDVTDSNHFEIIHVDPWKKAKDLESAIQLTADIIQYCFSLNDKILFEIGTEQGIMPYTADQLEKFLSEVSNKIGNKFNNVLYAVIQGGTLLQDTHNAGSLDEEKCSNMVKICKKFGLLSKEHNGDYLTPEQVSVRFDLGLDSINIAPEFGNSETVAIMQHMNDQLIDEFFNLCYESRAWVKWLPAGFVPRTENDKRKIIEVSGHYVFSHPKFYELKIKCEVSDQFLIDLHVKRIKNILTFMSKNNG